MTKGRNISLNYSELHLGTSSGLLPKQVRSSTVHVLLPCPHIYRERSDSTGSIVTLKWQTQTLNIPSIVVHQTLLSMLSLVQSSSIPLRFIRPHNVYKCTSFTIWI